MNHLVLGTAGHIDHGKSSLVKALTGIDPDRLQEEQARGITIELGFADLDLGADLHASIVDVPGHERFVRHMVAGATGIDAVMLVVAADEGVMPQTREHLHICSLLGVRQGFVALTKIDLADRDLREVVELELKEFLNSSFLKDCPVVPVSSRSGEGLDRIREEIRTLFGEMTCRSSEGIPRLPVDRSFNMHGFGTVVTGTLVAGILREGEEIEMLPGGDRGRIRGIQVHGHEVREASAGCRTAVNIQGLRCVQAPRGAVLSTPGRLQTTTRIWARVRLMETAPSSIRKGGTVRFHQGTGEQDARVRILGDVGEGEQEVEIILEQPAVLLPGDRFILRRPMPVDTLGGGEVTDNNPPRGREAREERASAAAGEPGMNDPVLLRLARQGRKGSRADALAVELGLAPEQFDVRLSALERDGRLVKAAGRLFTADALGRLEDGVLQRLERFHREAPLKQGMSGERLRGELCREMPQDSWRAFLNRLRAGSAIRIQADLLALASHQVMLAPEDESRILEMEDRFRAGGLEPPREDQVLAADGGADAGELLEILMDRGCLVRIDDGRPFHAEALANLRDLLREYARNSSTIDVAAFKKLAGVTRKNAIPLLEHLDGERQTRRVGNVREILIR